MNGIALLLVTAIVGVDYGWQPTADGDLEYIIQIEPVTLVALGEGQEVISQIDPYVQNIRRFRIRVGTDSVPRRGMPPRVGTPTPDAATFLDKTPGVRYGWQPVSSGGLEYIVQLDAARVQALQRGEQIVGELAPTVPAVVQYRLRVGNGSLPRTGVVANPSTAVAAANTAATIPPTNVRVAPPATRSPPPAVAATELAPAAAPRSSESVMLTAPTGQTSRSSDFSELPAQANLNRDGFRQESWPSNAPAVANPAARGGQYSWPNNVSTISDHGSSDPAAVFSTVPEPAGNQWETFPPPSAALIAAMLNWCRNNPPPAIDDWNQVNGVAAGGGRSIYDQSGQLPAGAYTSTIRDIPTIDSQGDPRANQGGNIQQFGVPRLTYGGSNEPPPGVASSPTATRDTSWPRSTWGQAGTIGNETEFNPIPSQPFDELGEAASWPNRQVSFESELPAAPAQQDFWAKLATDANDPNYAFLSSSTAPSDRPWPTLFWTVMALFASLGGNLYMGWIAADIVYRYRELAFEGRNFDVRRLWRRRGSDRSENRSENRDDDSREDRREERVESRPHDRDD